MRNDSPARFQSSRAFKLADRLYGHIFENIVPGKWPEGKRLPTKFRGQDT